MDTRENNMTEEMSIKNENIEKINNNDTIDKKDNDNSEETPKDEEITESSTSLEDQIEQLKHDLNESEDKYLRLMAEFDNYRKRVLKEKTDLILNGGEKVITSLLPVLDDFDRAEQNMLEADDLNSLKEGFGLVIEKLRNTLERDGLKKFDSKDEMFNVDYHEAIAMVPGQPEEIRGKVIDCIQTGYKLNDKVIRHAKVAVAE